MERDNRPEVPQPAPEFEGVADNEFLSFMTDYKSHLEVTDGSVMVIPALHTIANSLFQEQDKFDRRRTISSMQSRLERIEKAGLIKSQTIVPEGTKSKRKIFSQEDALIAGSYLYSANTLSRSSASNPNLMQDSLRNTSRLWGKNPRADKFREVAKSLGIPEEEEEHQLEEYAFMQKAEELLGLLPVGSDVLKKLDIPAMSDLIRDIKEEYPFYKSDDTKIPLEDFPISPEAVKIARFIFKYNTYQLGGLELDPKSLPPQEMLDAFRHVVDLGTQYEQYFRMKRTDQHTNVRVTLDDILTIKVNKLHRKLQEFHNKQKDQ